MRLIIISACAVLGLVSASMAGKMFMEESVRVEAELRDGSKLIGTVVPVGLALEIKTEALGKLSIPLNRIDKIDFAKDSAAATLQLL